MVWWNEIKTNSGIIEEKISTKQINGWGHMIKIPENTTTKPICQVKNKERMRKTKEEEEWEAIMGVIKEKIATWALLEK